MAGMTIDVDISRLIQALDRLNKTAERHLKVAARMTAEAIASEARARVRRRTGETAKGITIEETRKGDGYVVFVDRPEQPGLPGWLEFGTVKMTAAPFLFASARLEEATHDRRMRQALEDAIAEAER